MHYSNECLRFTGTFIRSVQTATGLTDTKMSEGIRKTETKLTNNRINWQQKIKKKDIYIYIYIYIYTHRQSYIKEITVHDDYV